MINTTSCFPLRSHDSAASRSTSMAAAQPAEPLCADTAQPVTLHDLLTGLIAREFPPDVLGCHQQPVDPGWTTVPGLIEMVAGYADNRDYSQPVLCDPLALTSPAARVHLLESETAALASIPSLRSDALGHCAEVLVMVSSAIIGAETFELKRDIDKVNDLLTALTNSNTSLFEPSARNAHASEARELMAADLRLLARDTIILVDQCTVLPTDSWYRPEKRAGTLEALNRHADALKKAADKLKQTYRKLRQPGPDPVYSACGELLSASPEAVLGALKVGSPLRDIALDKALVALKDACLPRTFDQALAQKAMGDSGFSGKLLNKLTLHPDGLKAIASSFEFSEGLQAVRFAPFDDARDIPAHMAGVSRVSTIFHVETVFPSEGIGNFHDYSNLRDVQSSRAKPFALTIHAMPLADGVVLLPEEGHFAINSGFMVKVPNVIIRQPRSGGRPPVEYALGSYLPEPGCSPCVVG